MKRFVMTVVLGLAFSSFGWSQSKCADLQKQFDRVRADRVGGDAWAAAKASLGDPTLTHQANGRITSALYRFEKCQAEFFINTEGRIYNKRFKLLDRVESRPAANVAAAPQGSSRPNVSPEMAERIRNLEATVRQLKAQISSLEQMVIALRKEAGISRNAPANNNRTNNRNRNNVPPPNAGAPNPRN